jgi:hypothetical protein
VLSILLQIKDIVEEIDTTRGQTKYEKSDTYSQKGGPY